MTKFKLAAAFAGISLGAVALANLLDDLFVVKKWGRVGFAENLESLEDLIFEDVKDRADAYLNAKIARTLTNEEEDE